jgi:hypothetical protein
MPAFAAALTGKFYRSTSSAKADVSLASLPSNLVLPLRARGC